PTQRPIEWQCSVVIQRSLHCLPDTSFAFMDRFLLRCYLRPAMLPGQAGVAAANHFRRLVLRDDRAHGKHCLSANGDAWGHKTLSAYPGSVFNPNGPVPVRHVGLTKIVVASAEKGTLGNTAMRTNNDRFKVKNEYFLPDPRVVTD